ncbi:MAG: T9SS type A sorting domain-containing protein, partial [Chitinophagales bacterium]
RFVDRVNLHWLEEYHADGYRFDLSKGFTQTNNPDNVGAWNNYDGSRVGLLQRMADVIWTDFPDAYLILEHFAANNEEQELSDYGMMLWGNMNHAYNELTMGWVATSSFDGISYKERFFNDPHLVGYMESHDEERLMFRNSAFGNTSNADHNTQNAETALQRGEMAAALFFTVPGPKMVWQFGELGYDEELNDCRLCPKPLHWEYYNNPARNHLYMVYKALIDLKLDNEAFQTDNFAIQTTGVAKQLRLLDESMNVVVIANGDVIAQDIIPPFPAAGTYYDYFSGESIEVVDAFATFNMTPGEFHIYTTEPLPTPELVTGIGDFDQAVYQIKNYPNPFNQSLNITYHLPKTGKVRLSIVDILGREVAVLQNGIEQAGEQIISWQASSLESGTYFFVLETEDGKATGKLNKVK